MTDDDTNDELEDELGDDEDEEEEESDEVARFLETLVAKEKVLLASDTTEIEALEPLIDEPEQLYEAILDSPAIDEIFVSETEFLDLLRKFRLAPP